MSKMDEIILVAPRAEVFENEALTFQGVLSNKGQVNRIMDNVANTYSTMRRGDAEENNDYKQPIPYAVLKRGNEVYVYKRLTGGGEVRLHNQLSMGVGGHQNDLGDLPFTETVFKNLMREFDEELYIHTDNIHLDTIGLINDDENEVGKVHLGILIIADLPLETKVEVRETDQLEGFWVKIDDLKNDDIYPNLESWSQFVVDILA